MSSLALLMNEFGRWLVVHLWQLSIELAILAAVVLVAIHMLRVRSGRLRHMFWCLVLAKPVATFLVASPLSLYWFLRPEPPASPTPEPRAVEYRLAATAYRRPRMPERPRSAPRVEVATVAAPPWWKMMDAHGFVAVVWSAVALLLGLRLVVGFAFASFLRRSAVVQRDGPLAELAKRTAQALGTGRRVRVAVSEVAHAPVLAGVLRPMVLLPRRLVEELPERQLGHVLAHEIAHARRLDNALLLVQRLAEMVLFFHPVVWLCGWTMRRQAEAACDDAVIAAYGDSAAYADSLTRVAETARGVRNQITRRLLVNTFTAAESNFAARVRRILGRRIGRTTAGLTVAAVAALITIGVVGLPTTAALKTRDGTGKEADKMNVTVRSVRRQDGKVWIDGMEDVDWGGSFFTREDSQARCLMETLKCAGREVDYADVMGLSGAAFKLTMAPNLFVAEIHSEMGMDWQEIVRRVWGVDYDWQAIALSDEENPDWREELHRAAAESIGRGVPIFYMNGEWNLLVGYREDGSAFICKPYAGDKEGYRESETPTGFVGDAWFASTLRVAGEPADRRESVVRSLQTAVELAGRAPEKDGDRLFGLDAYAAWIAAVESGEDVSLHSNAFSYSQLLTGRQAAADYLRRVADELDDEAGEHLFSAADRYEAIARRLDEGKHCVAAPWEESWTPENRAKEAQILRESLADEKAAVAEIEAALKAEGVDVQALRAMGHEAPGPFGSDGGGVGSAADSADDVVPITRERSSMKANVKREGGQVLLEGLRRWPSSMDQPGCYVACSRFLGFEHSPAWIYGGTGFAFALNVHRELCPSGTTLWSHGACKELAAGLGLRIEPAATAFRNSPDFAKKQEAGFEKVCAAIDEGLPVIGWEMEVPEYYVVCGYDEEGNYLFRDFDDSLGRVHHRKLGDTDIGALQLMIVRPDELAEDPTVVRRALKFALEVAEGKYGHGGEYATGLAGYDRWIAALEEPQTVLADDVAGMGLAYNAQCWAECRRHAGPFLEEATRRLDDEKLAGDLAEAAEQYRTVAARLNEVAELFPLELGKDAQMAERLRDASRREKAVAALRAARAAEAEGLVAMRRVEAEL